MDSRTDVVTASPKVASLKANLRMRFRERVEALARESERLEELNEKLCGNLCALVRDQNALPEVWGAFQPIAPEPDIRSAFSALVGTVRWAFPRVVGSELEFYEVSNLATMIRSPWGILEPDPQTCDAPLDGDAFSGLIIPGVAFDLAGRRLGRGRGFYDRVLAELKTETLKIGVGFEVQVSAEDLPAEAFDIPMDWVVTEARAIHCASGSIRPNA